MSIATKRAGIQAQLLRQFCKDAAELLKQFEHEFALADAGFYDDKQPPRKAPSP